VVHGVHVCHCIHPHHQQQQHHNVGCAAAAAAAAAGAGAAGAAAAGLDFLSSPSGPIAESQKLAAEAFGADQTWFLVNGCSVGVHAAVMATVKPGQSIIIARNAHISAFSACVLTGCAPLWLQPEVDPVHGIPHCPTPKELNETFQRAWAQGADVGAVIIVSPTYYGVSAKIAGGWGVRGGGWGASCVCAGRGEGSFGALMCQGPCAQSCACGAVCCSMEPSWTPCPHAILLLFSLYPHNSGQHLA
jgi:hypothetical protein